MPRVQIVVDSTIGLPGELAERYNITIVPMSIIFGDRTYREGVDLKPTEFYQMLEQAQELPTTTAPSPPEFLDAFVEASKDASGIVCITVTSGFSPTGLDSALSARETAKEVIPQIPIEVIDSRTAVGAYGFIALAAARAAEEGGNPAAVVEAAEQMKAKVTMVCTMDTLKYLEKGGRIGKAAYWASNIFSIKAILEVPTSTGVIEPLERVRTRAKALERLLTIVAERVGSKPVHVIVDHANTPGEAELLKERAESKLNCSEIHIVDWAPVAGVHCGPRAIGLSFYADA